MDFITLFLPSLILVFSPPSHETVLVLLPEQIDVTRSQCHAVCLDTHGTHHSPDHHVTLYDFYQPRVRCETPDCHQCLQPCNRIFDSLTACKSSCTSQPCRSSCHFIFTSLDALLQTGGYPVSSGHVTVGDIRECCQDVGNDQLYTTNMSGVSSQDTSLYIRWPIVSSSGNMSTIIHSYTHHGIYSIKQSRCI